MKAHEINKTMAAQGVRKIRFWEAFESGRSKYKPEIVRLDNASELGKSFNYIASADRTGEFWEKVRKYHDRFHASAAKILKLAFISGITSLLLLGCASRQNPPLPDLSQYSDVQRLDCQRFDGKGGVTVYISTQAANAWVRPTERVYDIINSELSDETVTWMMFKGQTAHNCGGYICFVEYTVLGKLDLSNYKYSEHYTSSKATGPDLRSTVQIGSSTQEGECKRNFEPLPAKPAQ